MAKLKPEVGGKISVWWATGVVNDKGENIATITKIEPYTGRYTHLGFDMILTLSAANVEKMEMTYDSSEYRLDKR